MATKTFNDICVEYAHQLGKGLPLTPAEMCNAVIMYLNAQITEMQGITTALQTAVTEAESSATEAINKADDVSETVNALPKVPTPTTSDDGKVIGVQSGAYALVEQSGGEAPANMVTTDTDQSIIAQKTFVNNEGTKFLSVIKENYSISIFGDTIGWSNSNNFEYLRANPNIKSDIMVNLPVTNGTLALKSDIPSYTEFSGVVYTQGGGAEISYGNNKINLPIIAGNNVIIDADDINRHIRVGLSKVLVYDKTNVVDFETFKITDNSGNNIIGSCSDIPNSLCVGSRVHGFNIYSKSRPTFNDVQAKLAFLSDIPNLDSYTDTIRIVQGSAGRGIAVHDTTNASPYTKYGYDKIETYGNSNTLQYTLNIPNKNGTIATLDDISSAPSTDSRYYTRVIYHSLDEDTQYVLFSCITDTDMTANTSYQNVIDLLNSLGATTNDTALPCGGKTVSGGILVGVYTDGTNIIVFDTDNATEELNMSAEIKFISK